MLILRDANQKPRSVQLNYLSHNSLAFWFRNGPKNVTCHQITHCVLSPDAGQIMQMSFHQFDRDSKYNILRFMHMYSVQNIREEMFCLTLFSIEKSKAKVSFATLWRRMNEMSRPKDVSKLRAKDDFNMCMKDELI